MKVFLISLAVLAGVILAAVIALGSLVVQGWMPDATVKRSDELKPRERAILSELLPLQKDETIRYYYSLGFWSHRDFPQVVTNQRVMSWINLEEGGRMFSAIDLDAVTELNWNPSDSWLDDSELELRTYDPKALFILTLAEGVEPSAALAAEQAMAMYDDGSDYVDDDYNFLTIWLSADKGRDREVYEWIRERVSKNHSLLAEYGEE